MFWIIKAQIHLLWVKSEKKKNKKREIKIKIIKKKSCIDQKVNSQVLSDHHFHAHENFPHTTQITPTNSNFPILVKSLQTKNKNEENKIKNNLKKIQMEELDRFPFNQTNHF